MEKSRRLILTILLIVCISSSIAGQDFNIKRPDALGVSFVGTRQDATQIHGSGMGPGLAVFLKYNVSRRFFSSCGLGVGTITDDFMRAENVKVTLLPAVDLKLGYHLTKEEKLLPFIYTGLQGFSSLYKEKNPSGLSSSTRSFDASILVGGGVEYLTNYQFSFYISGDYRYVFMSSSDPSQKHWVVEAGMTISLHREGFIADDIKYINNTSVEREMFSLETEFEVYSGEFRQFLIEIQTLMAEMDYRRMQIEDLKLRAESNANTIAEISQQYLGDQKNYEVLSIEDSLKNFKELYTTGLQKYHSKHYEEAIQIFKKILTYNTYHLLASNCQYWIGECYNMLGDYPKAIEAYQLVFEYPLSNKFDNTLFMSGLCHIKLGNRQIAEAYFKELFNRYPDSVYTSKVRQYLGNL